MKRPTVENYDKIKNKLKNNELLQGDELIKKYGIQVAIYTRYFTRIMANNGGLLIYTLILPVVLLLLNNTQALFHTVSNATYTAQMMPFIAWIIFSNTIVAVSMVVTLREKGYLKQYHTLVVNPSVIVVAQLVVNLAELIVMMVLIAVISAVAFKMALLPLVGRLWGMLLLTYVPIVGYCLPLLAVPLREKSLNAAINVVTLLVMFGSVGILTLVNGQIDNLFLNLISPVYLMLNAFQTLSRGAGGHFPLVYASVLLVWIAVGVVSYHHLRLLPTEDL